MRYSNAKTSFTIVDDTIESTFSSLGERDEKLSFTIEGAEQFLVELNHQIVKAKEARVRMIEKEMADMALDICKKQEYMGKRENDLQELRRSLGQTQDLI